MKTTTVKYGPKNSRGVTAHKIELIVKRFKNGISISEIQSKLEEEVSYVNVYVHVKKNEHLVMEKTADVRRYVVKYAA